MRAFISRCLVAAALAASLSPATAVSAQTGAAGQRQGNYQTDTAQSFLYTVTNPAGENAVAAFARDRSTGQIRAIGRYPTGGRGDPTVAAVSQHAIVSQGYYLYAVNPGSADISAFAVQQDGSLRLLAVVPSGGKAPVSLALHGDLLYVANFGGSPAAPAAEQLPANYRGFRIQPGGTPVPLPGSTVELERGDAPSDIVFNPHGCLLVGTRAGGGVIDSFWVAPSGLLVRVDLLRDQPGAFGAAFNPLRPWQLFADYAALGPGALQGAVASFQVDGSGRLTRTGVLEDPSLLAPCWLVLTPDGKLLWVSSAISRALTLFSVGSDGRLTLVSALAAAEGPASLDIALAGDARYLYQLRAVSLPPGQPVVPHIRVFRVTGGSSDAGLALVQDLTLPEDLAAAGVTGLTLVER
ncbi:MAG TPA: beta-propeller fold lactonase family protein [Polyangia bacterium]|jgi:6-phosphogluconolactonase (cycloisomerase 2 family)|nr:beta-propeller fold lactonase family protein [Polyangia bacterium]